MINNTCATELISAASRGDTRVVTDLLDAGADVDWRDERGMTALMHAVKGGHRETASALLDRGADAKARGKYLGYEAVVFAVKAGDADMLELLIKSAEFHPADTNFALGVAKLLGNQRVIKLLTRR
jgi:ankyrin repeat protein